MQVNRLPTTLAVCCALLLALVLVAPWLTSEGSIQELDGEAWQVDHGKRWETLSPVPRLAYTLGDLLCHQKAERSYLLHGNQMPVCARDVGLLAGLAVGFGVGVAAEGQARVGDSAARLLHVRRHALVALILAMLLAPLAIDGFLQLLTPYESTNVVRSTTGFLFGMGIALVSGILLLTDPRLE